jgi:tetratricopeptide (TPR) repeat protein
MLGYGHPMLLEPDMNTSHLTSKQLLDKVWQSLRNKDIKQAIDSSNLLGRNFPKFAPGWQVASHVAQFIKQPQSALVAINRALKLEPANIDWQLHRASCLLMNGDNESCGKYLLDLIADSNRYTLMQLTQLAFLCSRLELHDEAVLIYQRLIELEPTNGGHWYNLASIHRFRGQITQAGTSLEKAIVLNPEDFEAYELRSDLRRQTPDSNHVTQLKRLLERGIKMPSGEVRVCYALAKELEDIGDAEQSFSALARGATLRRKHINYSVSDDLQTIDAIMEIFSPALLAAPEKGNPTKEPVFVIGLPRTGTTLVERILGSHSKVFAAGELNNFVMQMMQQVRKHSDAQNLSRQELVKQTAKINFAQLGKAYLDSSRPLTGLTPHFVDKMPLNFLYAGLIQLSLPNAKIIHLTRHPMDTCYAIYKRLFQDGYPWSYDLKEIATYYLAYHRLMTHWKYAMPGVIHELSYEHLVTNFESGVRDLIDACDLNWESQCLDFAKNSATTTTASAAQVRQPVYTSSVHRWRDYESQLAPLAEILIDGGICID